MKKSIITGKRGIIKIVTPQNNTETMTMTYTVENSLTKRETKTKQHKI